MSIRVRLLLSYIAMLVVPVLLTGAAVLLIAAASFGSLKTLYQVDTKYKNPFHEVMEQEARISREILALRNSNPDAFLQPELVNPFAEKLTPINMELIVRKQNTILRVPEKLNSPALLEQLPVHGDFVEEKFIEGQSDYWMVVRQVDLTFSDGSPGSIFVVTDMSLVGKLTRNFTVLLMLALLVILIFTNGILTYFMSRSIIRPLRALQKAAENIAGGNLDSEIVVHAKDEIGELSRSFEEMRRKLKASVDLQMQYEENRRELISNISHDLKTPVTAIKGYVEGIIDGVTDTPEKLDKYVKTIYAKAGQMDHLIDELFLFSKLDLKKVPFHFEEVELITYLHDCAEELYVDLENKGIVLTLAVPERTGKLMVMADREKLKRVLMNIIGNAVKYMGREHGKVQLRVHEEADSAVVEIEDNGSGIPEEKLPHIFDRFYRGDAARSGTDGGSGLGLAIARQIVEEHGGSIRAASRLHVGTSVFFTLKKTGERSGRREEEGQ